MGDLKEIRRTIRTKRRAICGQERQQLSAQAAQHIIQYLQTCPEIRQVATFLSLPEEIDTAPINQGLWRLGYRLFLPVVVQKAQPLAWREYQPNSTLKPDQAGILVPLETAPVPQSLDAVIMPLVAFDPLGTRLGMGGGFYDRSFQGKINHQPPYLIGIAYACQWVTHLPRRAWDVPLDAVATADHLFHFPFTHYGEY